MKRTIRTAALALTLSLGAVAVSAAAPETAHAQTLVEQSPGRKGLFSVGVLGAELGFVVASAIPVDHWWPYLVIPPVTTAGGAIAGHFLIDNQPSRRTARASAALLAFSIALIVPTAVITVALGSYDPDDDDWEDEEDFGAPGDAEAAAERRRRERLARSGDGAIRVSEAGVLLSLPSVHVTPLADPSDPAAAGMRGAEVQFSLVSGSF